MRRRRFRGRGEAVSSRSRETALVGLMLGALALLALAALGAIGDWQRAGAEDDRRAVAISVGGAHACALLDSGEIVCWGANYFAQAFEPSGRFSAVSAGGWHTCGLRETGEIECWGHFYDGATLEPSGRFSAVSAGDRHSCGLRENGRGRVLGSQRLGRNGRAVGAVQRG